MGTPNFACPTLQKLIDDKTIELIAIYTKEPAISGRGQKINNSPIHNLALKHNLKIITPKTLKVPNKIQEFLDLKADAAIIVAYGLILPKEIIHGTKFGCINLHPSLLPQWRGAAPIQRTIMNGDNKTATTIIKMDEGIDSGDIINQEIFDLDDKINYTQLDEKFSNDGASLILKTLKELENNTAKFTKQDNSKSSYAKKIDKKESLINWNNSAKEINQQIRGLSGNIGAYFIHKNERIKILEAKIINFDQNNLKHGQILNNSMHISCNTGIIQPQILQKAGKKAMTLDEFLRGDNLSSF